jgi:2-methylisocitrate lyase-like PEP mutase family enzyme
MQQSSLLKQAIEQSGTVVLPGVFDGLSAKLAERAGFQALYASGGAIARSAGFPDLGLLSFAEVCDQISEIVEATRLPVIADADTGFGNALNVDRMVSRYQRLGVAGFHIEDQTFPKRCGHLNDKTLVPTEEMVHKIRVARDAIDDPDFLLIARTDAIAVEGFDQALARAEAYWEAGANMLFVEAPETVEQIELVAARLPQPKLINMFLGGKTPLVEMPKLRELGYQLVIIPSDLQRAAIRAMESTLAAIAQDGDSGSVSDSMASFNDREVIVETDRYLALDER